MATSYADGDRLTAVREAINRCLTAQDYSISGRSKRMAELKTLRAMEKELQTEGNQPTRMSTLGSFSRIK